MHLNLLAVTCHFKLSVFWLAKIKFLLKVLTPNIQDTKVYTDDGRVVTGKTLAVAARQESLPSYSTASNLISVSMDPVDDDNVFK